MARAQGADPLGVDVPRDGGGWGGGWRSISGGARIAVCGRRRTTTRSTRNSTSTITVDNGVPSWYACWRLPGPSAKATATTTTTTVVEAVPALPAAARDRGEQCRRHQRQRDRGAHTDPAPSTGAPSSGGALTAALCLTSTSTLATSATLAAATATDGHDSNTVDGAAGTRGGHVHGPVRAVAEARTGPAAPAPGAARQAQAGT